MESNGRMVKFCDPSQMFGHDFSSQRTWVIIIFSMLIFILCSLLFRILSVISVYASLRCIVAVLLFLCLLLSFCFPCLRNQPYNCKCIQ